MSEEFGHIPSGTGSRAAPQVGKANGADDVDGGKDRVAVGIEKIGGNYRHELIVSTCVRYGNAYDDRMPAKRPDLAAMLAPLLRELMAAEQPILDKHGVSMWGYVVLLALDETPMRSQAVLAQAIGADKTRIIRTLDDLQDRGYIERTPDPDDRRVRLLSITAAGRRLKDAVQADIQRGEEHWLGELSAEERRVFLKALQRLAPTPD